MEWKKVKFMQDRVGEEFDGLIISVTKFGLFVELTDLFVEGLVPLNTLTDDHYIYHENTREIIGQRTRKTYRLGQPVRVILDRIDPVEKETPVRLARRRTPPRKSAANAANNCRCISASPGLVIEFSSQPHPQPSKRRIPSCRDVAQPGRALAWGARGRQFKSARPDQLQLHLDFRACGDTPSRNFVPIKILAR